MTFTRRPGQMVVPGIYDDHGEVHFFPEEFLCGAGVVPTQHNIDVIAREFIAQWRARYPGVRIEEHEER